MKNLVTLFFCLIIWIDFGFSQKDVNSNVRPNIILIMTDDQGWGDVGYNGHPYIQTPNLDQMTNDGIEFTRFYAASAVCSPTRASVLTGRNPERFGVCYANCGHLKNEEISLPEMVKEVGYSTGHFGKWHLGTLTKDVEEANRGGRPKFDKDYSPPWENGYDECFVTESKVPTWDPMITPPKSAMDVGNKVEGIPFGTNYWIGPGQIVANNLEGDDSRVIMDRVLPFIDRAVKRQQPFLSVVWFHTPHLPVITGEKYKNIYKGLTQDQKNFYGCITAMDEQVGRLRDHLKKLNIDKNTLIFFASDNGPEGKDDTQRHAGQTYGLDGRKRSLKEGGIRVPGIMVWPGKVQKGRVINTPVYTSDYFPTIASILDIDIHKYKRPYDGVDIMQIIEFENGAVPKDRFLPFLLEDQAALIGNRYKIYKKDKTADWQLFDLLNDPNETTNISEEHMEIIEELKEKWATWKTSVDDSAKGNDY